MFDGGTRVEERYWRRKVNGQIIAGVSEPREGTTRRLIVYKGSERAKKTEVSKKARCQLQAKKKETPPSEDA